MDWAAGPRDFVWFCFISLDLIFQFDSINSLIRWEKGLYLFISFFPHLKHPETVTISDPKNDLQSTTVPLEGNEFSSQGTGKSRRTQSRTWQFVRPTAL